MLFLDIVVDLNKFYKTTNATIDNDYIKRPHLLELLYNPGSYMIRYVDDSLKEPNASLIEFPTIT